MIFCQENSISHEVMPDFEEHKNFVKSNPYRAWYLIYFKEEAVGSFYLSNDNSIELISRNIKILNA